MTEQEKIRRALRNPGRDVKMFLTVLYEANNFVSRGDLDKASRRDGYFIGPTKSMITRMLGKMPGLPVSADDLFYRDGSGGLRLRPEFWTVIGEVLGKRQEVRVSGMKVTVASVIRSAVDRGSTVNFEIYGLAMNDRGFSISVSVPPRSGNTRQSVEQACDILHARLLELAKSAESLKEDLSQWE